MTATLRQTAISKIEMRRRALALREADHACDREGLPPATSFARAFDDAWTEQRLSADAIVDELVAYHRVAD